jgi:hypothetical protein
MPERRVARCPGSRVAEAGRGPGQRVLRRATQVNGWVRPAGVA